MTTVAMTEELLSEINAYRDAYWGQVVSDIESLVEVASVENLDAAADNAPFGPGPRKALDRALAIAGRMGFTTADCQGYIGYADLPGASDMQIGIIGHVDVVPAGPGWIFEPYAVTRREGYLLGRGVVDDKGPLMVALHAVNFWKKRCEARGQRFPYTVRVLFGANEETNMKDVEYYRAHYADPAFLFTPDSQFPVGYGESGICSGTITSAPLDNQVTGALAEADSLDTSSNPADSSISLATGGASGCLVELEGGQAVNAVPGLAYAVIRADFEQLKAYKREGIELASAGEGLVRVEAHGVSAHASTPELGVNAIGLLMGFLLDSGVGSADERAFFQLENRIHSHFDGSGLGVHCADEHFGALSVVGGMVKLEDGCLRQSLDFRYPTTTTSQAIEATVNAEAHAAGATFALEHDKQPFLMNPDSPAVRALLNAYCKVTGNEAKGLTSKGGTYARCFTTGVSFGPEKPWESNPDWVGAMHGPDEGVSEDLLKQAFTIYALALGNLASCEL